MARQVKCRAPAHTAGMVATSTRYVNRNKKKNINESNTTFPVTFIQQCVSFVESLCTDAQQIPTEFLHRSVMQYRIGHNVGVFIIHICSVRN